MLCHHTCFRSPSVPCERPLLPVARTSTRSSVLVVAFVAAAFVALATDARAGASTTGKSKTTEVSMWRVEFEVDASCKVEASDRMTRISDESGENKVWITYQRSYSADMNFTIAGRGVDGDSPNNLIEALVDADAERYEKVLRKGKARKQKTRGKATVYYAVIDAVDRPIDIAPMADGNLKISTSEAGKPTKMKIYHLVVRDSNSASLEHVVIRTTSEDHKVTGKWLRGIILSMSM